MSPARLPDDHLHVDQRAEGPALVVRAVGEIDVATAPVLAQQLTRAAETVASPALVVADLREIQFLGSTAISTLIVAHQQYQNQRVTLRIVVGPSVKKRLSMFGLADFLAICLTLPEALRTSDQMTSHHPTT